jgi:competence protein CoiA
MPCCGASVVLKKSKLGTRFLAHSKTGECTTAPETAEHLLAKNTIAKAILAAGWTASTEHRGDAPGGDAWVADVMATRGNRHVAIEVQWSKQPQDETQERQRRYARSEVRGLWLMRHPQDLLTEKETPTFRLNYEESSHSFSIILPSESFDARWINNRNKNESGYWHQEIELSRFVAGALKGALKFAPAIGRKMPVSVHTAATNCWRCKKATSIVTAIEFLVGDVLKGHPSITTDIYTVDKAKDCNEILAAVFPANLLQQHGIGRIKNRFSKTMGGEYLSNGCRHCDALQGRFFDHESDYEVQPAYQVEAVLSEHLARQLDYASGQKFRWWFDEGMLESQPLPNLQSPE